MVCLPDGEESLKIRQLVLTEYTNITDGMARRHSVASRGSKLSVANTGCSLVYHVML